MATRPTVPQFVLQDSSLANLQNLSACVGFLGTTPVEWHFYKTADQGPLTAGTPTQITFSAVAFDPDGVQSSGAAVIQTQGYYDCEACLPFSNTASGGNSVQAYFQVVTGSNNPQGSGVTSRFGAIADLTTATAQESPVLFGTSPCLYVLDTVQVWLNVTGVAATVLHNAFVSVNLDLAGLPDGSATFTGMWISEGP